MIYGIIYCIKNLINGKMYIGQTTTSIEKRWKDHKRNKKTGMPISLAINKYGSSNFEITEICSCKNQEDLDDKEIFYVNEWHTWSPNGYNLRAGRGRGQMSEESKQKLSEINKGKFVSKETREKQRASHMGKIDGDKNPMFGKTGESNSFFGKHHSQETKDKMSKAKKGKPAHNKGKEASETTKEKFRGENNHSSKLTWFQVNEIREKHSNGQTQKSLAEEYNVCITSIYKIIKGLSWANY